MSSALRTNTDQLAPAFMSGLTIDCPDMFPSGFSGRVISLVDDVGDLRDSFIAENPTHLAVEL